MKCPNWIGNEQNIPFLPDEAKMVSKPMAAMIWRNCSPIFFSSSSPLTNSSSSSHPHPCSRCKFVLVQARPQLINRSRFLSPPSPAVSSFLFKEGKLQLNPSNPSPPPPLKRRPRSSITHLSDLLAAAEQEQLLTCVRTATSRHRWWKSLLKSNTLVRLPALPSSYQLPVLWNKRGETQSILIKPAKERYLNWMFSFESAKN